MNERIAVTGTPGTGKTTATKPLESVREIDVYHLNELIRDHGLFADRDEERDSLVADIEAIAAFLGEWNGVVESHLAHLLAVDRVVVLRCRPDVLERRLLDRGVDPESAAENAESEALDLLLSEAVNRHGTDAVYEIDTTDRSPEEVTAAIEAVIDGNRSPAAGTVDFTEYLHG